MVKATEEIWESFYGRLRWFVFRHIKDYHDGEDILQDIFLKIHNNIENLKNMEKFDAWAYRITRNAIADYYRRRRTLAPDAAPASEAGMDAAVEEATAGNPLSCIRPMIDHLPEKYKQAIIMTEYKGLTQKEMAEKLGLSVSGAKSRVQRAREMLKNMLLQCCHFEFDRRGNIIDYRHKLNSCPFCAGDCHGH